MQLPGLGKALASQGVSFKPEMVKPSEEINQKVRGGLEAAGQAANVQGALNKMARGVEFEKVSAPDKVQADIPSDFRKTQLNLAQALSEQAAGRGPSLAQMQLKQASDRAISQQLAMAAQARTPAQGALAQRLAMRQAGEQQQALAGQSGALRLQEQMAAQQALGEVAGAARGQDIQGAGLGLQAQQFSAQQALQAALANQAAGLQAQGIQTQALNIGAGMISDELRAKLAREQLAVQEALGQGGLEQQAYATELGVKQSNKAARDAKEQTILSGILQGAGSIGAAVLSDKTTKTDIEPITKEDLEEFWSAYHPVTFKYVDGAETIPGFVAQDIRNTKLGKDILVESDGLLRYDPIKMMGILSASYKLGV